VDVACRRFKKGVWSGLIDSVAEEVGIGLEIDGRPCRLFASPVGLEDLVLGHALLECCAPGQAPELRGRQGDVFQVGIGPGGLAQGRPGAGWPLAPEGIVQAMRAFLSEGGESWQATGCFHRAALFLAGEESFPALAEDIGRHNCIDRLAGACLRLGLAPGACALLVSARTTASLVAKAVRLGVPALVSRSAPTTGGIALARRHGLGLVGFVREERLTVFHDPQGLVAGSGAGQEPAP